MNIVMIGHKYVPSREGGIEVVVDNLSSRLALKGHNVVLFNRKRKKYGKTDEYKGCKIEEIFTINKKSLDAVIYSYFATKKVKRMIKQGKVDVVHYHAEGPCLFLKMLSKLKKKYKFNIVVTIHGLDWQRGKWGGFASKMIKKGEENAVKYADRIIVLSKNVQNYFKDTYNRETDYIPNGVDVPEIQEADIINKKYGLTKNSYILFLARIVPEKGLHYLLKAWKDLNKELTHNFKLVVAGNDFHNGEYYQEMLEEIRKDDSIIATGFTEGRELQELYSNAFLYVLPSDVEGMPMRLLEALSYGNQCLVSDIPENMEVIPSSAFCFKKGDSIDLKDNLKKIIIDGDCIRNHFVPFSWDATIAATLNLYRGEE